MPAFSTGRRCCGCIIVVFLVVINTLTYKAQATNTIFQLSIVYLSSFKEALCKAYFKVVQRLLALLFSNTRSSIPFKYVLLK